MQDGARKRRFKEIVMTRLVALLVGIAWLLSGIGGCASAAGETAGADAGQPVTVIAHLDIARTAIDRAVVLLDGYVATSRQQQGNLDVEVLRQVSNPNHFTLVENWASRSAYDAHLGSAASREFHRQLDPLLGSPHDERLYREAAGG
jgi:quinol monooxygenase YgiN